MKAARVNDGLIPRRDPTVRAIARSWRALTAPDARDRHADRRTLIACSGGGDSCGLALALAAAVSSPHDQFVIAHIVHDLRPRSQALADRDAARSLADALGLPFVEAEVAPAARGGNAESTARRLRYQALARLAKDTRCRFIATAHHAHDQLETVLMSLIRGAGVQGLAGVQPSRSFRGVQIIRPALASTRTDLQRLCTQAGWKWNEDATNNDLSRLRAALRARVIPELERIRPGAAIRAEAASRHIAGAAALIRSHAERLLGSGNSWPRAELRTQPTIVIGDLLRLAAKQIRSGKGRDQWTDRAIQPIIAAIRDAKTQPRRFTVGGLEVEVTSRHVSIRKPTDA